MSKFFCVALLMTSGLVLAPAQQQAPIVPAITFSSVGFVKSVEMAGTAMWHYGSDEQTGRVALTAFANGQSQMTLHLSRGTRIETQNTFTDADRTCTWTGFDGIAHNVSPHNCWLSTVWFLPQITLQAGAGAPDGFISFAATSDSNTIILHSVRRMTAVRDSKTTDLVVSLSSVDLGIDYASGLPQWLLFNIHPDNDGGTNLPVEVDFSDYRTTNGITVPFHIQKLINHTLVLDLQISTVQTQ
jgi:hypothetical protein